MRSRSIEQSVKSRIIEYIQPRTELMKCRVAANDSDTELTRPCLIVSCQREEERVLGSGIWKLSVSVEAQVNYVLEEGAKPKASLDTIFAAAESLLLGAGIEDKLSTPLLKFFAVMPDRPVEEQIEGDIRTRTLSLSIFAAQLGKASQ